MLKNRLIPVVLLRDGVAVQSKGFRRYQALGNPLTIVDRLSDWCSDELIYLDISADPDQHATLSILDQIAQRCFMPLTFGGGIRTLDDVRARIEGGADKAAINTQALTDPAIITAAANRFGAQCVVVGIDAAQRDNGWSVRCPASKTDVRTDAVQWAREAEDRGAGEILLQSVDRDGKGSGYDLELIRAVSDAVSIPVIALGGVGEWAHLSEGLAAGASAVAAANIFNHTEQAVYKAKRSLFDAGANVREPRFRMREVGAA